MKTNLNVIVPLTAEDGTTVKLNVETNTLDAIAAACRPDGSFDEDAYCVALTGFNKAELDASFDAVKNSDHWKNPIRATIPLDRVTVTAAAITHFHGSVPKVEVDNGVAIITGPGYVC